jgi:ectoine hydroxylase-related dioxygenase (phytanoyl-CoA dioxygenase family)
MLRMNTTLEAQPRLTAEQVDTFRRQGYVKGPKILSDPQVDVLREEVLRVIADRERKDVAQPVLCHNICASASTPLWQIVNIWMASEAFKELVLSDTVASLVAQLIDAKELRVWHDQIQYKPASTGGVNMWHQDSPYWGILTPKDQQCTAWVALDDIDEENGCMKMVPGSQHWGNTIDFLHTLKEFDDMEKVREHNGQRVEVKACPVRKGEVHFHHSLTWHGSGRNLSGRPRRAIALHFLTENSRYLATGNHVMRRFVHVNDGEVLTGDAFPLVWSAQGN